MRAAAEHPSDGVGSRHGHYSCPLLYCEIAWDCPMCEGGEVKVIARGQANGSIDR